MAGVAHNADLRSSPGFRPFWAAATVSAFGTYVTTLAVQVLVVLTLGGGAAEVGLVSAARWLPYLLFGVFAGVFVDRARRRPVLVTTDFVRGILLVAIPALATVHHLSLVVLVAFMIVFGLASLANDAASQSFLPRLVPPGLLTRANARLDQSDAVAQTSGPALAGGLISLLSAPWAVLVDAASYFASGLLVMRVPVTEPPSRRFSLRGVRGEAVDGLRWVYRHPTLGPYVLSTHGWFVFNAIASATLPLFALRTMGLSPFGLGLALAAGGVGGLLGALSAAALGARFGAGRIVIASIAGNGMAWAVIAAAGHGWSGWVVFGVGEFLLGLTMGTANSNEMGYLQAITPDHLQGRSNATRRSVNRAMIVIGAPLGGVLADALGYRPMLYAAAVGFALVSASLAISPYRHARLDDPAPATG
ncbi:MFS transporter [Jatrophihabitans sp.]|jgi:MFS family permease|uniref:MFS transporter n=1 Tax=Jatrophihabitans sp. TaxID=1932789 RepID=UPI002EFBD4AD